MAGSAPRQSKHQKDEELPSPTSSLILGSSWLPNFCQSTVCVYLSFSHVRLFVTPWTVAWLCMEFSRQEY